MSTLMVSLKGRPAARLGGLMVTCVLAGVIGSGGVAWAAGPPEAPLTRAATGITGISAVFEGTLNPKSVGTAGYYFAYNSNGTCTEGPTTEPGAEATGEAIPVSTLVGLVPSTKYTFCLVATHTEGETTLSTFGSPLSFETEALAPAVDFEAAESVTPFATFFEGFVNPQNQPTTACVFEYGTTAAYGTSLPCEPPALEGYGDQFISFALSGLAPSTTFHYRVHVANATGTTDGPDMEFTTLPAEKPIVDSESTSEHTPTSVFLEAQINPDFQETTCKFQYGTDSTLASSTTIGCEQAGLGSGFGDQLASARPENLLSGETYYYRVTAENATGKTEGAIMSFTTVGHPLVSTGEAVNPSRSSVLLFGTVDPVGALTEYHFAYIDQAGYDAAVAGGAKNPYAEGGLTSSIELAEGYGAQAVESKATGLLPATTYHYALVASNSQGTVTGADKTFATTAFTPPILTTEPASGVGQNTAVLSATVNTQGLLTTYGFEIGGAAGAYGQPTGLGYIGAGASEANVTLSLTGLQPGTTYHYRITATNGDGISYGQDQTFTTGTFPNVLVTPPAPLPFVAVPSTTFPPEASATPLVNPKPNKKTKKKTKHHKKPKRKAKHKKK